MTKPLTRILKLMLKLDFEQMWTVECAAHEMRRKTAIKGLRGLFFGNKKKFGGLFWDDCKHPRANTNGSKKRS